MPSDAAEVRANKTRSGRVAYLSGSSAEDCVAREYSRRGYELIAKRWRGTLGELDLVIRDGEKLIFVEVKKSKSFKNAALRLSSRQIQRIFATASEYLAMMPKGQLTEMRFDAAFVDGHGAVKILENALIEG